MSFKLILAAVASLPLAQCIQSHFLSGSSGFSATKKGGAPKHVYPAHDNVLGVPEASLSGLSTQEYATLWHPSFPAHEVRMKRAEGWCDPTVKTYTGYVDTETKHLFFWFFESRSEPEKDDLLMFINGGPGGSSALGLLMELGPCLINTTSKGNETTYFNPHGWNDKANLFFIDQPVGVGYSYADYGETIETTEDAAKDIAAFMYIFTETFSEFKGRPFHMSGESYGGRYVPVFASEIVDQNKRAVAGGFTPINLASVLIGNGCTELVTMYVSYYDLACTNASISPVLDISTCVRMKRAVPRCEKMMKNHCFTDFDDLACSAASLFCGNEMMAPLFGSGRNPYDISGFCEEGNPFCYSEFAAIQDYLNREDIRSVLGVDPKFGNYSTVATDLNEAFSRRMDEFFPTQYYVSALLERGVDVLIYVGTYDWICNWVGNAGWLAELQWHGQAEYNSTEFEDWTVDGHVAGMTKKAKGLTFATVLDSGHMVPYDKPVEALELLNRWMYSRTL